MWHVSFEGRPAAIRRSLCEYGAGLGGDPRLHFDEACPVLEALVGLSKEDANVILTAAGDGKSVSVVLVKAGAVHVQ